MSFNNLTSPPPLQIVPRMNTPEIAAPIAALFDTDSLAGLGPRSRAGVLSESEARARTDAALNASDAPAEAHDLILSAALLWHDHLDASHTVSQDLHSASGSFLHGIMHRREPDYSNAKYWFTRTGSHPTFPDIAERAAALLDDAGESGLRDQLIPGGDWDSFAMVDACAAAERGRLYPEQGAALQRIQQIEILTLVEAFCRGEG